MKPELITPLQQLAHDLDQRMDHRHGSADRDLLFPDALEHLAQFTSFSSQHPLYIGLTLKHFINEPTDSQRLLEGTDWTLETIEQLLTNILIDSASHNQNQCLQALTAIAKAAQAFKQLVAQHPIVLKHDRSFLPTIEQMEQEQALLNSAYLLRLPIAAQLDLIRERWVYRSVVFKNVFDKCKLQYKWSFDDAFAGFITLGEYGRAIEHESVLMGLEHIERQTTKGVYA